MTSPSPGFSNRKPVFSLPPATMLLGSHEKPSPGFEDAMSKNATGGVSARKGSPGSSRIWSTFVLSA
jgi:hypothetical protein